MTAEVHRRISVILPVYRQADHVAAVVENYLTALASIPADVELLLVANGGDTATIAACNKLADTHETVTSSPINESGWGQAVRHGLAIAQGDLICYTNSSRTSAADLTLMLLYGIANPKMVIKANRKIRDSLLRRLGSLLYNLEVRALFDLPMWDVNGTPKVFPRELEPLRTLTRNDDLIDLEFNVICRQRGYQMLEVPILSSRRHGGRSTTNWRSALRLYAGAWRLKRNWQEEMPS